MTLKAFEAEAERFARTVAPAEFGATLVTLSGELGAGKTAFTKVVARTLGVDEVITSPTFVIEKIYQLPTPQSDAGFARLVHIDAYRLESGADLVPLGFDEIMRDLRTLILLEWPERVADMLPAPEVQITIAVNDDGSRTITYA